MPVSIKVNDTVDWSPLQQQQQSNTTTGRTAGADGGGVGVPQPKAKRPEARLVTNGKTRLKRRQLRQLGWTLLSVPYFDFDFGSTRTESHPGRRERESASGTPRDGTAVSHAVSVIVAKIEERNDQRLADARELNNDQRMVL